MTISERIARNAKEICRKRKIPIQELEKKVGVCIWYLSRIRGKHMMPVDTGYAIADALGVSMELIMRENVEREIKIAELKKELARLEAEE